VFPVTAECAKGGQVSHGEHGRLPSVLRDQADSTSLSGTGSISMARSPRPARENRVGMASRTLWSGTEPKPLPRIRKSTLRRGGAGEPNGLSGGLANFDQAGGTRTIGAKASGESFKEQFGRASTQAADDHVNSLLRISSERLADGVFGFIEADDGIYSGGLEGSEIPACSDDALGAEMPGHLNGEAASDASSDQDEDGFSESQADIPGLGMAAAKGSSRPSGSSRHLSRGTTASSDMVPQGFLAKAKYMRVPSSREPTPSTPGTIGTCPVPA